VYNISVEVITEVSKRLPVFEKHTSEGLLRAYTFNAGGFFKVM
jgi:hypothetical protein